ncbi:uncharacterized protein BKA55DRAFT_572698 [Fusarium redolens]|uniref:Secreted protein n=1 Tax=Fusarium redolens TaxID=48865 RepID=A0A9P9GZF2_FUSRE|nr:uncharacterized protein BKA55DRAFT_572698 [Fusarium redolens]KAH7247652.1 hypothetical protein BKA55DRAFT_572698 [Fusarium redolens]
MLTFALRISLVLTSSKRVTAMGLDQSELSSVAIPYPMLSSARGVSRHNTGGGPRVESVRPPRAGLFVVGKPIG